MLKGTRFYYDRHGRYQGKTSEYGPITHAFWQIIILGAGALFLISWVADNWVTITWIVLAIAAAFAVARIAISISSDRSPLLWGLLLGIIASLAVSLFVLGPLPPTPVAQKAFPAAEKSRSSSTEAVDSPAIQPSQRTQASETPSNSKVPTNGSSSSQAAESSSAENQPRAMWYYCDPLGAYFPYVSRCPIPWRAVNPTSVSSAPTQSAQPDANAEQSDSVQTPTESAPGVSK